jgi:ribosomal protein L12E/L44/L45/RPP1/RPP2
VRPLISDLQQLAAGLPSAAAAAAAAGAGAAGSGNGAPYSDDVEGSAAEDDEEVVDAEFSRD